MDRAKIFFIFIYLLYLLSPYVSILEHFLAFATKKSDFKPDARGFGWLYNVDMAQQFHPQSAIILGMHDAIVSLLGLIAGLYFAFTDTKIIIISCIIASITAALSMSAANYLATRAENNSRALWAGFYTGAAYLATCAALILPFIVFHHQTVALISVFLIAILIIYLFNLVFYHGRDFYRHFGEMLGICTIISVVAFLIGEIAHYMFGI